MRGRPDPGSGADRENTSDDYYQHDDLDEHADYEVYEVIVDADGNEYELVDDEYDDLEDSDADDDDETYDRDAVYDGPFGYDDLEEGDLDRPGWQRIVGTAGATIALAALGIGMLAVAFLLFVTVFN